MLSTTTTPGRLSLKARGPAHQPLEAANLPGALLRIATVVAVTGLSPATIYRRVAARTFPTPVRMGQRCSRWPADAVRAWLSAQGAAQ